VAEALGQFALGQRAAGPMLQSELSEPSSKAAGVGCWHAISPHFSEVLPENSEDLNLG
jgi:hypothetical protein